MSTQEKALAILGIIVIVAFILSLFPWKKK